MNRQFKLFFFGVLAVVILAAAATFPIIKNKVGMNNIANYAENVESEINMIKRYGVLKEKIRSESEDKEFKRLRKKIDKIMESSTDEMKKLWQELR